MGITPMVKGDLTRAVRLQIMLSPQEMEAVSDYRFQNRMPSQAAAVRDLLRLGLASSGFTVAVAGQHSGDFGVMGTKKGKPPKGRPPQSS